MKVLVILLAVGLVAVGCTRQGVPTGELTKVSLRLPWIVNAQFAGYYVALEKGFFRQQGIDITIQPGGIDKNPITLVAAGTDTFGLHDTGSLLLARVQGIPVVAVATFYQKHPGGVMALQSSGIRSVKDFVGKSVGFQEGGPWMLTKAMMKANGVDPASVKPVAVQYDISPLLQKKVDLFTVFATNEPILAQQQGSPVIVFLPADLGVPTASDALFTTETYLKEHPDVVRKMVQAMRQGWEYALTHKEEAIDILAKYGEQIDKKLELLKLQAEEPFIITADTKTHGIGYMTAQRWDEMYRVLQTEGALKEKVDVTKAYTLEFVGR